MLRTLSPARRRAAKPALRPLQKAVKRGMERRGQVGDEVVVMDSRAMRTRPLRISWTREFVEIGSSRRRMGLTCVRSVWMQNQTWPRRLPKMVPMTICLEGRGGAVAEEEVEEHGEVSWFKEVLERFFLVWVVVVVV